MEIASAEQRGVTFFWDPRRVPHTEEERARKVASMILLYVGTYSPLALIAKIGIDGIGIW